MSDRSPARHPAVDTYISKARPFAQPILTHLREAIHRAAPGVEEQIKWSRPFFVLDGVILGNLSAFKEHCSLGLWGSEMAEKLREGGVPSKDGMGTFGRITALTDLPDPPVLDGYIRHAAELIRSGHRPKSIQRVAKPARKPAEPAIPAAFAQALRENGAAGERFAAMSPSCRREYIEWIGGAKREETRIRRIGAALGLIAEGKALHWKYERSA